jgi:Glycosyltransferase family 87
MEEPHSSPSSPVRPAIATPWRRPAGLISAVTLGGVCALLATPGFEMQATSDENAPGWIEGVFGSGIVNRPIMYLCLLWLAIALWVAVLAFARDLGPRIVAWLGGGLIVLFVLAPPLLSLDVFSYISYARLGADHGLNPYEFAPSALPPGDDAGSRVIDYSDAVSVYGPAFTIATYPLGLVGVPVALWSMKALAGVVLAALAALTARLARIRGVDPAAAVAFVALNPLLLVHLVGGAHNDGLMVLVAVAAAGAMAGARPLASGAGFALAAAVKASGLIYAPFAVAGARGERTRFLVGAALGAALIGGLSFLAFGGHVTEAIDVAGGNQDRISRFSVPATLARASGIDVDVWRAVLLGALIAAAVGLLVATFRGFDWLRAAGWATLGVLVASAYIVPWYLVWLVPVAAVSRDRALIGATILITVFQAINAIPVSL